MSAPKRVQMTRQRPWRTENPDAVIVARPSKWGNPFRPVRRADGVWIVMDDNGVDYPYEHRTRDEAVATAVELFEWDLVTIAESRRAEVRAELAGRDLACWCKTTNPCHADVLLEIANGDQP